MDTRPQQTKVIQYIFNDYHSGLYEDLFGSDGE